MDVQAPHRPPSDPPAPPQKSARLLAAVANAPERLLLVFLWFCYVAAIAYVSGLFRPVIVVPATVVVVALTWRWVPDRGGREAATTAPADWKSAVGGLLGLTTAGVWFLLNLPYLSERVQVNRDPDIYTLTALWLLDHASPSIPVHEISSGTLGFPLVDGSLGPQGNHLVAGVSAAAGWLFGEEAVFWGNLACGAAALLAFYVLAKRVVGPFWSLVPVLGLAVSLPMLEFSRALYSEPLAMTFIFLGASVLWSAWQRDSVAGYLLAGAAFGGVAFARIDGTLPLIGVLVGLTLAAFVHPGRAESRRRWSAPLVLLGSLPGIVLGLVDILLHSGTYAANLGGQLVLLAAGFLVATVISLVGAVVTVPARVLSWAATAGAVLGGGIFLVLLSRPWWYEAHGGLDNGLVAGIQQLEGDPIDGTRLYSEATFQWLSWYYGWPVVLVGLAGLLAWLVLGGRTKATALLWLSALFLPSALLYLTTPNITPDQIWAMRRFIPVVIPGILLATVWVARTLVARRSFGGLPLRVAGGVAAAALVATTVWSPLTTTPELWAEKNNAGALDGNRQVCDLIDGRPTVVTGNDTYLPTVLVLCDVPAVSIPQPDEELLAEAHEELGGGDVALVTRDPGHVPWVDEEAPAQFTWLQEVWERSLTEPPDEVLPQIIGVSLGAVQEDGSVEPQEP